MPRTPEQLPNCGFCHQPVEPHDDSLVFMIRMHPDYQYTYDGSGLFHHHIQENDRCQGNAVTRYEISQSEEARGIYEDMIRLHVVAQLALLGINFMSIY